MRVSLLPESMRARAKLYDEEGHLIYEGSFVAGLYDGEGIHYDASSKIILRGANFLKAERKESKVYDENGNYSTRVRLLTRIEGDGILYDASGNVAYEGGFEKGRNPAKERIPEWCSYL